LKEIVVLDRGREEFVVLEDLPVCAVWMKG